MKKKLKPIIGFILISILVFLGYSITKKINYKSKVNERIKVIPHFSFNSINDSSFNNSNLKINNFKLFIYYNSECDYCQSEVIQINNKIDDFKNTQLIFVSFETKDSIKSFATKHNLLNKENIVFLQDSKFEFEKIFDVKNIPFTLLYSKKNQLIQKFKGAVKIEDILKQIN